MQEKVRHELSAPYDSNTNAFIERARRTVFEGVCTALLQSGALRDFGAKRSNIKFLQLMFFLRSLTPKVSQRFLSLGKTYWKEIGDPSTLTTLWPLEPQRRAMSLFKGAKEANNRPKEDLLKAQFWVMSRICPHTGSGILKLKKPGVSRSTLLFAMKDTIRSVTRKIGLRKRFWIRPVFHQQSKGFCPQPSGKNFHRGGG